jgi:hypothetical protein
MFVAAIALAYSLGLVRFESGNKYRSDSWKNDWVVGE